ncbi:hypothetical protein [Pseudofrankia asymbiotica]|uniref:Uncharacterized protein n=1 Tax=Pseudofrankia asymbiotica TaxID=1834516 RepID=A0A1V2HZ95_9ACTN|nr:hypothetical protein [Pseudofrankia asymbiotica]ONH21904.1 hypothetical protein BL253_37400 [Pseudofrankia asymbiotica]
MAASDVAIPANWNGGFYELAINLGPPDDARLESALAATWAAAGVAGCLARGEDGEFRPAPCTLPSLERFGHLHGAVRLPDGGDVVCGAVTIREDHGDDWLDFYLPLGALADHDPRVGGFPFGDDGGNISRAWREPIDTWLANVATAVHEGVRYRYAVIGFEVAGLSLQEVTGGPSRYDHVLHHTGEGLEQLPTIRWDFGMPA